MGGGTKFVNQMQFYDYCALLCKERRLNNIVFVFCFLKSFAEYSANKRVITRETDVDATMQKRNSCNIEDGYNMFISCLVTLRLLINRVCAGYQRDGSVLYVCMW